MPRRIAISDLNGRTVDILNTIRANASYAYQNQVPVISDAKDLPKVGEVLMGYPALANEFVNALVNRIALVKINSATFNNAYAELKKGFLEFGETVEEVFVQIAKAREFSVVKAESREFKRTLPDVRAAFHAINWKVQYPLTIQNEDLRMAFQSFDGVENLIAKLIESVYTGAEYDEFLLFKYLIIKSVASGKMYPVAYNGSDMKNAAKSFRGMSNMLTFMSDKYNANGVHTVTPKSDQYIFMDAQFNANYDVDVLASAFNMDKATFMGHLKLIDSFTTFDNDRFAEIRANCDALELVTDTELALMADVKAVLVDKEWFQIYDNLANMTETYVASGMYWNYFYNVWKTVSTSPFSNAVVFVDGSVPADPATITLTVKGVITSDTGAVIVTVEPTFTGASYTDRVPEFIQTSAATTNGIAVHKYGAYIFPSASVTETPAFALGNSTYTGATAINPASVAVGDTITCNKD